MDRMMGMGMAPNMGAKDRTSINLKQSAKRCARRIISSRRKGLSVKKG